MDKIGWHSVSSWLILIVLLAGVNAAFVSELIMRDFYCPSYLHERYIYIFLFHYIHICGYSLSYFSKCNYPVRLNYGKEITKIFSCQQSESSQHILGGLNVGYSFTLFSFSSGPPPQTFKTPAYTSF